MKDTNKLILRGLVETLLDFQKARIALGNRIIMNFRYKLGQDPGTKLADAERQKLLEALKQEAKRITDAVAGNHRKLKSYFKRYEGLISESFEYDYINAYLDMERKEKEILKVIDYYLDRFPIWTEWLSKIEGVGPTLGAYIVSWLDPYKAPRPSSFWRYAGLHVVDGRAPVRRKGEKADWNHRLRSKLLGVLGDQFVKRPQSTYGRIYRDYKHRLEHHAQWRQTTPGHRHRAAIRYAVKMFLKDLWMEWRLLEGLPVVPDYAAAKLGMAHHEGLRQAA